MFLDFQLISQNFSFFSTFFSEEEIRKLREAISVMEDSQRMQEIQAELLQKEITELHRNVKRSNVDYK